jgi:[ribosomal protein S18]-alanine N-acetyltransferase
LPSISSDDETIRDMTEEDIKEVLEIEQISFPAPWSRQIFEETLSSPISRALVLEKRGNLIGYMLLYSVRDEAHILNLAIDPGKRMRGHAAQLMRHAILELGRMGVTDFYLEVREGNRGAMTLYEGCGFRVVGKRKRYYRETNEDALVMHLSLSWCGTTHGA